MLNSDESKGWKHSNLQGDTEMHILSFFVAPSEKQQGKLCLQPIPHAKANSTFSQISAKTALGF